MYCVRLYTFMLDSRRVPECFKAINLIRIKVSWIVRGVYMKVFNPIEVLIRLLMDYKGPR